MLTLALRQEMAAELGLPLALLLQPATSQPSQPQFLVSIDDRERQHRKLVKRSALIHECQRIVDCTGPSDHRFRECCLAESFLYASASFDGVGDNNEVVRPDVATSILAAVRAWRIRSRAAGKEARGRGAATSREGVICSSYGFSLDFLGDLNATSNIGRASGHAPLWPRRQRSWPLFGDP
ncbi:hypothetical protein F4821DRAFT_265185 [Hypoxylon rubiginosum]|uniref:Uncharacterized protein n=1 Tax=Hypoxylon rubiginosum TaxID=110542 RepID=A0ACC0CLH6_9PEZI|nr:hypothetical protein F4821DRAFT_265185 [Hypoxylon rubiginosum]